MCSIHCTADSTAKDRKLGKSWGTCSKHRHTLLVLSNERHGHAGAAKLQRSTEYITPLKKLSFGPSEALCCERKTLEHRGPAGFLVSVEVQTPNVSIEPRCRPCSCATSGPKTCLAPQPILEVDVVCMHLLHRALHEMIHKECPVCKVGLEVVAAT